MKPKEFVFLTILLLMFWALIGWSICKGYGGRGLKNDNGVQSQVVYSESKLCEYRNGDLYYKAPCSVIIDVINLKKERENFELYISSSINKFKTDCKSFTENNIYYNLKSREGYEYMTLDNFKKMEDVQIILNWSCELH